MIGLKTIPHGRGQHRELEQARPTTRSYFIDFCLPVPELALRFDVAFEDIGPTLARMVQPPERHLPRHASVATKHDAHRPGCGKCAFAFGCAGALCGAAGAQF